MKRIGIHIKVLSVTLLSLAVAGCTLQPSYVPYKPADMNWSAEMVQGEALPSRWWTELHDPAVDKLIAMAYEDNPTLGEALGRVDEAKAAAGIAKSDSVPGINLNAGISKDRDSSGQSTNGSIGAELSWEIDLFGRIKNSVKAAESRLRAVSADADKLRIVLAADIAESVISLRACRQTLNKQDGEIASFRRSLRLMDASYSAGVASAGEVSEIISDLEGAVSSRASQKGVCVRMENALTALSGADRGKIRDYLEIKPEKGDQDFIPDPPEISPKIAAEVIIRHPAVMSANSSAEGAWREIGVARAGRMPKLNLSALLAGQWITAGGSTIGFTAWSAGAAVSGAVFDGGRGKSSVEAAEARYMQAAAVLEQTVRTTVQEVEDALASCQSSDERMVSALRYNLAGQALFHSDSLMFDNGIISLYQLETSRRQLIASEMEMTAARRDRASAWVSLVLATGASAETSSIKYSRHLNNE